MSTPWVAAVALTALDHFRGRLPTLLLRFATEGSEAAAPGKQRDLIAALTAFIQDIEGCSSERASAKAHVVMASVSHRVFSELAFSEPVDQRDDETFVRELSNLLNHTAEAK